MTRLESGAVEVRRDWHSVEEIVGAAFNRLESTLGKRPIRVDMPAELPLVSVDDVLIEQVFINLLENAAKYTPEDSEIQVTAFARDDKVVVEVADRGPGFAPGDEKRIWEKFYRGPAQGVRGVGLGLAICRSHHHGARRKNRSGEPSGRWSADSRRAPHRRATATGGPGRVALAEILIVEDDPQIRRFLRATFTAEQYRFQEAVTAAEGIAQAAARQPDLIVLDLGLPDRDGLEVIRKVREWTQTPIIVLSARGQERDKITALDSGADDFVSKPFAVGELLARVRAALRRSATISDTANGATFRAGGISVDLERRVVTLTGPKYI